MSNEIFLERGVELIEELHLITPPTHRLALSSGIQPAPETFNRHHYCASAFIPQEPWRSPTPEELTMLYASSSSEVKAGTWVSIFRVPDVILHPFRRLREAAQGMQIIEDIGLYIATNDWQVGYKGVLDYCSQFGSPDEKFIDKPRIRVNTPGLPTVTIDEELSCLIGLHLDSWYQVPFSERHLSPNRISINLGTQERYLLYLNLSLQRLSEVVSRSYSQQEAEPFRSTNLPDSFLHLYPSYPIVRLRVEPGEAYIAPTENIIHDGSTMGQTSFDIQLTVRGHFDPWPRTTPPASV